MTRYDDAEIKDILFAAQSSSQPVCLYGPPGCGKSRLINLTWASKNPMLDVAISGPVSLNVDDSIDAKSVVGTFRSSLSEAGRFEWVDGLLVELIRKGRWLVLEDVDKVNQDILSILPRDGDTHFEVRETGERVPIHPNFGLFGTSTLANETKLRRTLHGWLFMECRYPANLLAIIESSLPPLIANLLLDAYKAVSTSEAQSKGHYERALGLHDLFRAVHRVSLILPELRLSDTSSFVTEYQRSRMGSELIEVFANHSPFPDRRAEIVHAIENGLGCDASIGADNCPAFSSDSVSVSIGDLSLKRKVEKATSAPDSSFTLTSVHLQAMQRLGRCISLGESVLVVGDTGVGKTTTIQFLSRELGAHMHVYNFSDQTEGADLVGGLKPVMEIEKLVKECEVLIKTTLPESSQKSGLAVLEYIVDKSNKRDMNAVMKAVEKTAARAIALFETAPQHEAAMSAWKALMAACVGSGKIFRFVEGPLIKAVRNGDWILLDEINLAPPDVLRILNGLIENRQIAIAETGEIVHMHTDFRLFAAMNPPHLGRGKRALPASLRSRFTEIYCNEVTERSDLVKLVQQSLERDLTISTLTMAVPKIVDLYLKLKTDSFASQLSNLEGGPPVFSLRSLSRALEFTKRLLRSPMRAPGAISGDGTNEIIDGLKVSLTSAIDSRSERIVVGLIDSMVGYTKPISGGYRESQPAPGWARVETQWIAMGSEPVCSSVKFILTESVRKNLKKLAVCLAGGKVARPPILCEGSTGAGKTSLVSYLAATTGHRLVRINNHEHTDLQDYFGQYVSDVSSGGLVFQEGPLVEAVRNGYWVLLDELNLAPSEVLEALNRLLDDNRELTIPETGETVKAHADFVLFATQNPVTMEYGGRKSLSRAFRNRFIDVQIDEIPEDELGEILKKKCEIADSTAQRMLSTYTELSRLRRLDRVLSGRDSALITVRDLIRWALRKPTTREEIAIEGYLVLAERLRTNEQKLLVEKVLEEKIGVKNLINIIKRLYISESDKVWSYMVNTAIDKGQYLVRTEGLNRTIALVSKALACGESVLLVGETGTGKTSATQLVADLFKKSLRIINCHQHMETGDLVGQVQPVNGQLSWVDGPLVQACKEGSWILLDEVNLADDSVVERLNSLLDMDYKALSLAEKPQSTGIDSHVLAHNEFRLICTMNPGNDFGKKELSSALRNRFCEVWIDNIEFAPNKDSSGYVVVESLIGQSPELETACKTICAAIGFAIAHVSCLHVSSRDAILWASFVMNMIQDGGNMYVVLAHGACVVLLDPLTKSSHDYATMYAYLETLLPGHIAEAAGTGWYGEWSGLKISNQIGPFKLPSDCSFNTNGFALEAPTSGMNFAKLLRSVSGSKRPILLHGDPGAGKSSVVAALASFFNKPLVRINLSDQTELADILGQNVPVGDSFEWRDGILLEAVQQGHWVLLDELNLAPQPVLEGLNALLDHRAEVYVPAIDRLVKCPPSFRLFATQNEAQNGDGRKMLPRSLLSRFSRIHVDQLSSQDLIVVGKNYLTNEKISNQLVIKSVEIIVQLSTCIGGGLWNLRDLTRLLATVTDTTRGLDPNVVWMVLASRLDAHADRIKARDIIASVLNCLPAAIDPARYLSDDMLIRAGSSHNPDLLACQSESAATVALALNSGSHVIVSGAVGKKSVIQVVAPTSMAQIYMHSQMDTSDLIGQFMQGPDGVFEWRDSVLTTFVRNGGTVVLVNAHRCPPSILDRLNALIEIGGKLVIPEKGTPETIVPHNKFRLVLLTDSPGQLSMAIRNRCVHVHVPKTDKDDFFDKLRVARTVIADLLSNELAVDIANRCETITQVHQVSRLVSRGLSPDLAVFFITQTVYEKNGKNFSPLLPCVVSQCSSIDRQRALFNGHLDPLLVKAWFILSSTNDWDQRLNILGISSHVRPGKSGLVDRIMVQLLLRELPIGNDQSLSSLHSILHSRPCRGSPGFTSTCFDYLLDYSDSFDCKFSGSYRQTSNTVITSLLELANSGRITGPALIELVATAITLRSSPAEVASENEERLLEGLEKFFAHTPLNIPKGNEEINSIVTTCLRTYAGMSSETVGKYMRCGIALTQADLLLLTNTDVKLSHLLNRYVETDWLNSSLTSGVRTIQTLIDTHLACGDVGSTIDQLTLLIERTKPRMIDFINAEEEIVKKILSIELPEYDVHAEKNIAVKAFTDEIHSLHEEAHTFSICRMVSGGLGTDDSATQSWLSTISRSRTKIFESGIYVRPESAHVYVQLRYLVTEFQSRLPILLNQSHGRQSMVSFVKTIMSGEYENFFDINRGIANLVLQLVAILPPINTESSHHALPFKRKDLSCSQLVSVGLTPIDHELVGEKLSSIVEAAIEAQNQETADQITVGDIVVDMSALVENNDKARADAAVQQLHDELFTTTTSTREVEEIEKIALALVAGVDNEAIEKILIDHFRYGQNEDSAVSDAVARVVLTKVVNHLQKVNLETVTDSETADQLDDDDQKYMSEQKIRLAEYIKNGGRIVSFYSPHGGKEAITMLSGPLTSLQRVIARMQHNHSEIADHPDIMSLVDRVNTALALPISSSALAALEAAEQVLDGVAKTEQAVPSRYWDTDTVSSSVNLVTKLRGVVARLRASEVASWKDLVSQRELLLAQRESGRWLSHLWASRNEDLFDITLAWLRSGGIVQFNFRISLLEAVGKLTGNRVLLHVVSYCRLAWTGPIRSALKEARIELNKSVFALIKELQFRLGGRHYSGEKFKMDTKRSHMQIATVVKRFEERVLVSCSDIIGQSSIGLLPSGTASSTASLIRETIQAIKDGPTDKSGKNIKQRLLADLTGEVKQCLTDLSIDHISLAPLRSLSFTPEVVHRTIMSNKEPNSITASLLGGAMKVLSLPHVDQTNQVKPAILAELRQMATRSLELYGLASQSVQEQARISHLYSLYSSGHVLVEKNFLIQVLEWSSEMGIIIRQLMVIQDENIHCEPLIIPRLICDQLNDPLLPNDVIVSDNYLSSLSDWIEKISSNLTQSVFGNRLEDQLDHGVKISQAIANYPIRLLDMKETSLCVKESPDTIASTTIAIMDLIAFLTENGLCTIEYEPENRGEGQTEWNDGTGLGSGDGVNDKSDEIEDAGQFDTDKDKQEKEEEDEKNSDEPDLNKGVDANADQSMDQDEEHNMPQSDEDEDKDEHDREMGDVDLDDGGDVDEDGAPPNQDDVEEENDVEESVEVKNKQEGEDDTRANEKRSNQQQDEHNGEDESFDDNEKEESESEQSDEDDNSGEDEKFEAFLDQPAEEQDESMDQSGDELMEDDIMEENGENDDESEEESSQEENITGDINQVDNESNCEDDPNLEQQINNTDESRDENGQQDNEKNGQEGEQTGSDQVSKDMTGGDSSLSEKNDKTSFSAVPKAPNAIEPNTGEALEEWLKQISEIVKNDIQRTENVNGDTGEIDDNSSKGVVAETQIAGHGMEGDDNQETKVNDEHMEDNNQESQQEGVNREDMIMAPDEEEDLVCDEKTFENNKIITESINTREQKRVEIISPIVGTSEDISQETNDMSRLPAICEDPSAVIPDVPVLDLSVAEGQVSRLTSQLCEKLLAVLEPTKRGRLEGFFKTGKRISMRRVLSWIASDYRKDKFWLRRTRPSQREYRVMICMDNTLSMRSNGVGEMSLLCVSALAQSLRLLDVGKIGLLSFGTSVREIGALEDTWTADIRQLANEIRFNEESSSSFSDAFPAVVHKCADIFKADDHNIGSLALVITDGRFDKDKCRPYVQELVAAGHVPVLIVMDANSEESILAVTSVHFEEDGGNKKRKIVRKPFLSQSDCPFPFYAVIQDPSQLPSTLADILRQWIEISQK